jgi:hypothetical protein
MLLLCQQRAWALSYSDPDMPDGADMADRTASGRRSLIAMLIVWALIVAAAALIALPLMIVALIFLALVIVAATLIGRGWGGTLAGLALVAILALGALYALGNTLESYPCDAGGSDPKCGISNAPGP